MVHRSLQAYSDVYKYTRVFVSSLGYVCFFFFDQKHKLAESIFNKIKQTSLHSCRVQDKARLTSSELS